MTFSVSRFLCLIFCLVLVASPRARSLQLNDPRLNLGKWGTLFSESGLEKKFFLLSVSDGQIRMSVLKNGSQPKGFIWSHRAYKISDDRVVIADSDKFGDFFIFHLPDLHSEIIPGPEGLQGRKLVGNLLVASYAKDEILFFGASEFLKYSLSQKKWESIDSKPEGPSFGYSFFGEIESTGALLWGPLQGFQIWDGANWKGVGWGSKLAPKTDTAYGTAVVSTESGVAVKMKTMSGRSLYFLERAKLAKLDRQSNFEDYLIESLPSTSDHLRNIEILGDGRCIVLYNPDGELDFQVYDRLTGRWSGPSKLKKGLTKDSLYLSPDLYYFESSKLRNLKVIDQTIGQGEDHFRINCPESQPLPIFNNPTMVAQGVELDRIKKNIQKSEGESIQILPDQRKKLAIAGFSLLVIFWLIERLTKAIVARARKIQHDEDEGNDSEQVVPLSVFEDPAVLVTKSTNVKTSDHTETTREMRLKSQGLKLFHYLYISVGSLYFVNVYSKSIEDLITQTPLAFLATLSAHNVGLCGLLIGTSYYIGRTLIRWPWLVAIAVTSLGLVVGLTVILWPLEFLIIGIFLGFLMTLPTQIFGYLWELTLGSNILRVGLLLIGPCFLSLAVQLHEGFDKKKFQSDAMTEVCDLFENSSYFADCYSYVGLMTGKSQRAPRNTRPDWESAWALSHRNPNLCIEGGIGSREGLACLLQYSAALEPQCEIIGGNFALSEYKGPSGAKALDTTRLVKECEAIVHGDKSCAESGLLAISQAACQTLRAIQKKDIDLCPKEWFNNITCHRQINLLRNDRPRLVRSTNLYVNEPFCEEDAKSPVCLARLSAISGESKYCDLIIEEKERSTCRYLSLMTLTQKRQLTGSWIKDQCQGIERHLPGLDGKCERAIMAAHGLK